MGDATALQEYEKFVATRPERWDWGSATDIRSVDVSIAEGQGSTDPSVTHALEQRSPWFLNEPSPAEHVSSVSSESLVIFVSVSGDAPFVLGGGVFAERDELRTPRGQIRQQISYIRVASQLDYNERLARRLEVLLETMQDEGETWAAESPESLRRMLLFLESVPSFRCPTVTVTPLATFRAQWTEGENAHFALDFLADGQVRFVVFCPDPHHPDRVRRLSGTTGWESVTEVVGPFRVHRWTEDART